MVIGLYDIDLHHGVTKFPNLELCKIYNYHLKNNDKVIMMTPKTDKGRFNEIIYFKETPSLGIPKSLNINMLKDHIYGYGFYHCYTPINQKYQPISPNIICYEPFRNKLNKMAYDWAQKHSFIRVENSDFTGYQKDSDKILIADCNFAALPNAIDFMKEFKYKFLYTRPGALNVDNLTTAEQLLRPRVLMKSVYLKCKYDFNFFEQYYKQDIDFHLSTPYENENENHYLNRLVRTILYYKSRSAAPTYFCTSIHKFNPIAAWGCKKTQLSYDEYYKDDKIALNLLYEVPTEIRLLLKTKPTQPQIFDLNQYL